MSNTYPPSGRSQRTTSRCAGAEGDEAMKIPTAAARTASTATPRDTQTPHRRFLPAPTEGEPLRDCFLSWTTCLSFFFGILFLWDKGSQAVARRQVSESPL